MPALVAGVDDSISVMSGRWQRLSGGGSPASNRPCGYHTAVARHHGIPLMRFLQLPCDRRRSGRLFDWNGSEVPGAAEPFSCQAEAEGRAAQALNWQSGDFGSERQ